MKVDKLYVENIANQIKERIKELPTVAIILGSGLAGVVDKFEDKVEIKYTELKDMLIPSVQGHINQFVVGKLGGKVVIAMQGRFHAYDGFDAKECAFPLYVFKLLGVETVIITNSSGAINPNYKPGDIMMIKSHINFTGMNPLVGGAIIDYGEQFIDLKYTYDIDYRQKFRQICYNHNIPVQEGVFAQALGPTYETPAEVDMYRICGVDAVCMSTVLETIAAGQCNMKVLGLSCISNIAVSYNDAVITHEDVLKTSQQTAKSLTIALEEFLKEI
ncbi:MAG: purine-nucleoside phosphorylase [Clostridiales bacterium]|nr:purine-nucleoside phosphorylase [Candidatus Apopatousia equi]